MRLAVRIRAIKTAGVPALLVVLLLLTSLGIAAGDPGAWTDGLGTAQAVPVAGDGISDDGSSGDQGVMAAQRQEIDVNCGPSVTCLPVLLLAGSVLLFLTPGPDRDIDLPRHLVDLWQPRPMAPVPIA